MAVIEDSLRAYLITEATVTALLSSTASIRTGLEPQENQLPAISIKLISDPVEYHSAGMLALGDALILCNCNSLNRTTSRSIAEAIRLLFVTQYSGTMGSLTVSCGEYQSARDIPVKRPGGSEKPIFTVAVQLRLQYQQELS